MAERAGSSTSLACCSIKTAGRSQKRERPALHRCFSLGCVRLGTPLIFLLLIFQLATSCHVSQIFFRLAVQDQLGIRQWVIVDKVVQFCLLRHGHIQRILNPGAVDGDFAPIPEQQLHAPGVHVKRTGSCIVLHNRILQILLLAYGL